VIWCIFYEATVNIIIPGKTALVRVTRSWHIDTDMRTQEQSITAERERSGKRSGAGQRVRWAEQSGSRKKRAERGAGSRGAVSELNLPLMALKPLVLCTICTLLFSEAKRCPGPRTSPLDFGGNPMTFFGLLPFSLRWSIVVTV